MKLKRIAGALTLLFMLTQAVPQAYAAGGGNKTYTRAGTENRALETKMENTLIFRIDNSEAYVKNVRTEIDTGDESVTPFTQNKKAYIPLEFTVSSLGGEYKKTADNAAVFTLDGTEKTVEDGKNFGDDAAVLSRGKLYVSAGDFGKATGRSVIETDSLVVIPTTREYKPSLAKNESDRLNELLLYKWYNAYLGANGYATGIMVHPKDKTQVYCRTDVGGAYRLNTEHNVWYSITDDISDSDTNKRSDIVLGMAPDPNDPETIYLATAYDVLKTTDGGRSWRELGLNRKLTDSQNRLIGEAIAVDPNDSNTIFFGSDKEGLFISRDGGEHWIRAIGIPQDSDYGIRCMVFDENSGESGKGSQTAYVGVSGYGVYVTHDGGKSFTKMNGSPTHQARMKLTGGRLYVTMMKKSGTMATSMQGGLYVYRNSEWKNITPPPVYGKDMAALAVRESDPDYIITAMAPFVGTDMFRSRDGGATWEKLAYTRNSADICFNPLNEKELFITYGAGVDKIVDTDETAARTERFDVGIEEFCTMVTKSVPGAKAKLFTGNLDWGLFRNYELTQRADSIGNPGMADCVSITYSGETPNIMLAAGSSLNYGTGTALLEISEDYGESFKLVDSWDKSKHILEAAIGARPNQSGSPNVMIYTFDGDKPGYYISSDGLKTWQYQEWAGKGSSSVWARSNQTLAADSVDPDTFYICKNNQIYVTRDAGGSWKAASSIPAPPNNFTRITSVPNRAGTIAYTSTTGLYISSNYGSTWRQCDELTWAYAVGFGKGKDDKTLAMYAYGRKNGRSGIYLSDDMGRTWRIINEQNYICAAVHISGDMNTYGRVYVAASGRGVRVGQPVTVKDLKPVITVEKPKDSITASNTYTVRGSVSQSAEVRINGKTVPTDGNFKFEDTVTLSEGDNRISVEAVSDGKLKAEPRYIDIKYVPGYVNLTLDKEIEYISESQKITVSGQSTAPGKVYINGAEYSLDSQNRFSAEITLSEGDNAFSIYAADDKGNKSSEHNFTVRWDTTLPEYEIVEPETEVDTTYYILKLKMNENGQFRIDGKNVIGCNKDAVTEYMVQLAEGVNKIKVEARDLAHNVAKPTELVISSTARPVQTDKLDAGYIDRNAIKLDGDLSESVWKGEHILTKAIQGACNNIVKFDTYWNEDALYVGVNVKDSVIKCDSNAVYEDDAIEMYIDADNCKAAKYCAGTRQLQFRCDGAIPVAGGVKYAAKRTADGYSMEIEIPWEAFGVTPEPDMKIGFDIGNDDDDGTAGGGRSGLLGWNNPKDTNYMSPKDFATLKLVK